MRAKGADTTRNLKLNETSFVVPPKQTCQHESAGNTIEAAKRIFTPERAAWVRSLSNAVGLRQEQHANPRTCFAADFNQFEVAVLGIRRCPTSHHQNPTAGQ